MEPVSMTIGAIAALFFAKAVDKGTDGAVEAADKSVRAVIDWIRRKLSADDKALVAAAEYPDSQKAVDALAAQIDLVVADPVAHAELKDLLDDAEAANPGSISQYADGTQIVQTGHVTRSTVTVTQGTQPPTV